jgi:two-component system, OmpR family, response regulator
VSKIKIIVVEDDKTLQAALAYNLVKEGYDVKSALDGIQALDLARQEKPDLILLDLMLPGMSGLEVCRILRSESSVPIIILTARGEEIDKVTGLDLGADDYITKPFSMRELLARVRARLRIKEKSAGKNTLSFGNITMDIARHVVMKDVLPLELTPKEFDLLAFLAQNAGLVFSREQLLEKVWGYDYGGGTRTVDVHIRWLREKIEPDPENPRHLITVRGTGYKLEV